MKNKIVFLSLLIASVAHAGEDSTELNIHQKFLGGGAALGVVGGMYNEYGIYRLNKYVSDAKVLLANTKQGEVSGELLEAIHNAENSQYKLSWMKRYRFLFGAYTGVLTYGAISMKDWKPKRFDTELAPLSGTVSSDGKPAQ